MKHCRISPSAAKTWVECPASVQMQEKYPGNANSEAAFAGRDAHSAAEALLQNRSIPKHLKISPEMMPAILRYVGIIKSYNIETLHLEEKIYCPRIHSKSFGTCDAWGIKADILHVFDFKSGFLPNFAYQNYQLLHYVSGILFFKIPIKIEAALKKIRLHIIQPRVISGKEHDCWEIDRLQMPEYEEFLAKKAENVLSKAPNFRIGECCRFCTARYVCPQLATVCTAIVDSTNIKYRPTSGVFNDLSVIELSPGEISTELVQLQNAADILKYRITGLEAQAIKTIRAGKIVPEFSLKPTFRREEWALSVREMIDLSDEKGVNLRKPLEIITPAQARKKGLEKEFVNSFTKKEPSGYKLVRDGINKFKRIFKNEK